MANGDDKDRQGPPTDFAGPVFENPDNVRPMTDTEAPEMRLPKGVTLDTSNAPISEPKMDTSSPPKADVIPPMMREMSAHPANTGFEPIGGLGRPLPDQMRGVSLGALPPEGEPELARRQAVTLGPSTDVMRRDFHQGMRDFDDQLARNAYERGQLSVNDPQYLNKMQFSSAQEHDIKAQRASFKQEHPWGTLENHPGFFGKLAHGLARAGEVAADIVAPGVTSVIPGTPENEMMVQRGEEAARQKDIGGELAAQRTQIAEEQAQAAGERASAAEQTAAAATKRADTGQQKEDTEENKLLNQLGSAWKDALDHGVQNPMDSPKVKDAIAGIQATRPVKSDPGMKAVTLQLPGGQRVAGKVDHEGSLLTEDGKPAPQGTMLYDKPASGAALAPTKTATVMGEDGVPRIMQWNPATGTYDRPLGISASGAPGHEMFQAGVVERGGKQLIADLRNPDNRAILGNLQSYIEQGTLGTPFADQRAAQLNSELKSFAALQPAMHGFRARTAQQAFEKIIGGLAQNPDATVGSIEGILRTATGAIIPRAGGEGGGGAAPKVGDIKTYQGKQYKFRGGRNIQANWVEEPGTK